MMKAIKNFMNKPITWGDSFKWSGTFLGLYAAVIGACVAYEKLKMEVEDGTTLAQSA